MIEITAVDYVKEVNQAGEGVWVVLHLYKQGYDWSSLISSSHSLILHIDRIPLCALINQFMQSMAVKFPTVKFIKSVSTTCIPNYPDRNLPTVFVYYQNDMKKQFIGPLAFNGMNLKQDDFEWMLHRAGAVSSTLSRDPNRDFEPRKLNGGDAEEQMIKTIRDGLFSGGRRDDSDDEDDY